MTTDANGKAELKQMLSDDYTIKETKAPNGYDTADDQGITSTEFSPANQTVTKTFVDKKTPTTIDVTVKKVWDDVDNQDGLRPTSITVRLLADGVDTGKTLTLDKNGSWQGSFTGLNEKNASGQTITYTVKEDPTIASYIPTITGNATSGYTITNSHTPEVTSISVTKKWVGLTGSAVTVKLLANGSDSGKTLTLDAAGNWTGTFSNLPKYKDGVPITYTVTEASVTGVDMSKYTVAITGDVTSGFTITNTNIEKVDVPVKKEWVGPKAGPVTVHLLADGTDTGKTVTLSDANSWTDTFSGLDKYNADGTEIIYSVKEDEVSGYTSEVTGDATTGFTVTNTEVPHDTPKPKEDTPKKSGRKPAKKSGGVAPYTGDANVLSAVVTLGTGAIVLLGTGAYLRKENK